MAKRTIIGAAVGLGLGLAVAGAAAALAAPGGGAGLSQRIELVHTTIPTGAHTTVEASCQPGEILSGGGYTVYSIGSADKVFSNSPANDKTWHVEILNETGGGLQVDVFAVCIKLGH